MRYILAGDPAELDKLIRENRIRIQRGVISVTPLADAPEADTKEPAAADSKSAPEADTKEPKPARPKNRA